MRKIVAISSVFFALFAYGLFLAHYDVRVVADFKTSNPPEFYDYRGITNVHTDQGIGSGSLQQVITAAQDVGADFLFLTDLNQFGELPSIDGYHRKLLVLRGASYSYLDSRILAYGIEDQSSLDTLGQAQILLADLLSRSGQDAEEDLLVLAHPFKPGYQWTGAYPSGLDGIEVVNLKSIWQNAWNESKLSSFWSVLVYPFNSDLAWLRLYSEPVDEVRLWDQLNTKQKTIGFAGSDATARTGGIGQFHLQFPSYHVLFSLLSNHVLLKSELTGEPSSDRKKIIDAFNSGQFYMSIDLLGDPKGFTAYLQEGERIYPMGSTLKHRNGLRFNIRLGQKPRVDFETVILKDGERVLASNSRDTEYVIHEPGVYRAIVRVIPSLPLPDGKRWITWIYTNPFYVE